MKVLVLLGLGTPNPPILLVRTSSAEVKGILCLGGRPIIGCGCIFINPSQAPRAGRAPLHPPPGGGSKWILALGKLHIYMERVPLNPDGFKVTTTTTIGLRPAGYISVKGVLGAQPLGYTAEIDLWHRGPSRAPVSQDISMAP